MTEIEELKEKLKLTENDRDEWKLKAKDLLEENKKLKKELAEQIDGGNGLRDEIEYWKRKCKELEKENKCLKARNEELNENCFGLKRENDRLKKDLEYYIKFYDEHDGPIDRGAYENEDGLLYEEGLYS